MPEVHYLPDYLAVDIGQEQSILNASLMSGIPHTHVCGGNARCSTCRVLIMDGLENCNPRNEKETTLASKLQLVPAVRLACQTTITGPVKLRRLVLDDEDIALVDQMRHSTMPVAVGEEKRIAILFSDIRGFTPFTENLLPYDVIHVLNRYFHLVGEVIKHNGGMINNYMGDGIMALFGVDDPIDAPLNAVRASLEMLQQVEQLKPYLIHTYGKAFDIGIGIHYGEAVVGMLGATDNKVTTAIGDSVNFASRIESANKDAGTRLLISYDTYMAIQNRVEIGKTSVLKLKGKSGDYELFEVVGLY